MSAQQLARDEALRAALDRWHTEMPYLGLPQTGSETERGRLENEPQGSITIHTRNGHLRGLSEGEPIQKKQEAQGLSVPAAEYADIPAQPSLGG